MKPINRNRILELLRSNKGYINEVNTTLGEFATGVGAKYASYYRWLYANLRRGDRRGRALERELRKLSGEDLVRVLRGAANWVSDKVQAGRRSARGYAKLILFEHDLMAKIGEIYLQVTKLELKVTPGLGDGELLSSAIELKEREHDFLISAYGFVGDLTESFDELGMEAWAARARGFFKRIDELIERLEKWLEEMRGMLPEVWRYSLRVSARVVRGWAPGRTIAVPGVPGLRPPRSRPDPRHPPRWVTMTIEMAKELVELSKEEQRKRIIKWLDEQREAREIDEEKTTGFLGKKLVRVGLVEKSPIFVELFIEKFVSSLDEERLEDRYRDELIALVEARVNKVARALNFESVILDEWDFGIESKEGKDFKEKTTKDLWEIYTYPPSGWAVFIDSGYHTHPVGEKEKK